MSDTQSQRYRDRLRSDGRGRVIATARRLRGMFDNYVSVRQGQTQAFTPTRELLWGRIAVVVIGLIGVVVGGLLLVWH